MRQSADIQGQVAAGSAAANRLVLAVAGFVLIVGLPTAFWMLVLELAAWMFGFDYGAAARIWLGVGLSTVLAMVWGLLCGATQNKAPGTAKSDLNRPVLAPGTAQTTAGLTAS